MDRILSAPSTSEHHPSAKKQRNKHFFLPGTIRTRMLLSYLFIAILPVGIVMAVSGSLGVINAQQRMIGQLESISSLKERELNNWIKGIKNDLYIELQRDAENQRIPTLLNADSRSIEYKLAYRGQKERLLGTVKLEGVFDELMLIDKEGNILVSTNDAQEGKNVKSEFYFQNGRLNFYLPPLSKPAASSRRDLYAAHPIKASSGETIGVIAGKVNLDLLDTIMTDWSGMGKTGETYLVGMNYAPITQTRFEFSQQSLIQTKGTQAAIRDRLNNSGIYPNYRGAVVVGVYRWLPLLQASVMTEQERNEGFYTAFMANAIGVGVSLATIILSILIALLTTRSIASPLASLTQTAREIASGNLELEANIKSQDEIGILANAFNSMTGQLKRLISGLEQRVADRTRDLERRTNHLQVASEVARDITTTTDLDELLRRSVNLIRDRFGYYHAGIFMLDSRNDYAILREATGEAGRKMVERNHKLKVGEIGIVGMAAGTGKYHIARDVNLDSAHFKNPLLPQTRSEIALPLVVADRVIGVLDVQSTQNDDFSEEDITILQTMADQLAVAIENARLIQQLNQSIQELERAYQQYTQESWKSFIQNANRKRSYRYQQLTVQSVNDLRPEAQQAIEQEQTILINPDQSDQKPAAEGKNCALAIPIRLRGQIIGVLNLRYAVETLDPNTVTLVEEAALRLSMVLENARLLEETRQRAQNEQLLGKITANMRQTLDIDAVLQTATHDLFQELGLKEVSVWLSKTTEETTPLMKGNGQKRTQERHLENS